MNGLPLEVAKLKWTRCLLFYFREVALLLKVMGIASAIFFSSQILAAESPAEHSHQGGGASEIAPEHQVDSYEKNGLVSALHEKEKGADINITVDFERMRQSKDFWMHHVPSSDFERYPNSVAWSLAKLSLIDCAHYLLAARPQWDKARLNFIVSGRDGDGVLREHLAYTSVYDRTLDAKIGAKDPNDIDILLAIPGSSFSQWFSDRLDRERPAASVPSQKHQTMSVEDLLLDAQALKGKVVDVDGYTTCTPGGVQMCMLFTDPMNFTKSIIYDGRNLSRDDRKRLLECGLLNGCKVAVHGTVQMEPLSMISAIRVDWGDGMRTTTGNQSGGPSTSDGDPMTVQDFLLDAPHFVGRGVSVKGSAQCDGHSCWLTQTALLSNQIVSFENGNLTRGDRKRLLECDQPFSAGCDVIISGKVGGNGKLYAAHVQWN